MSSIYENNGYWYYQTYVKDSSGKSVRVQRTLHTTDERTARVQKKKWDKTYELGLFITRVPFEEVIEEWLREREEKVRRGELSPLTVRSDRGSFKEFRRFVESRGKTVYLDEFDGESGESFFEEFIRYRRTGGVSDNTVRRDLRHISVLFSFLQKRRTSEGTPRLSSNPFVNLTLPRPTRRRNFPDRSDWSLLRKYLKDSVGMGEYDWFKTMIHLQVETGCRISEVLTLKWEQGEDDVIVGGGRTFSYLFDNNGRWKLYSKRRERTVPLREMGLDSVISRIPRVGGTTYVFENLQTHRPYLVTSVSRMFKRLLKEVGVQKIFSTHGNRHGFCSYLLNNGISPYQVGQLVGHSSSQITELYGHVDTDTLGSLFVQMNERTRDTPKKDSVGKKTGRRKQGV
jgi:integrase